MQPDLLQKNRKRSAHLQTTRLDHVLPQMHREHLDLWMQPDLLQMSRQGHDLLQKNPKRSALLQMSRLDHVLPQTHRERLGL